MRKVCPLGANSRLPTVSFAPPVANMKKWSIRRKSSDHRGCNAINEPQADANSGKENTGI